jgi:hypothetical protein
VHEEVERLIVRALCFHWALEMMRTRSLAEYTQPKVISAGAFAPGEMATVIVREGYAAVGLKDAYSPEELAAGAIPFRMGIFTDAERTMLEADPQRAALPRTGVLAWPQLSAPLRERRRSARRTMGHNGRPRRASRRKGGPGDRVRLARCGLLKASSI